MKAAFVAARVPGQPGPSIVALLFENKGSGLPGGEIKQNGVSAEGGLTFFLCPAVYHNCASGCLLAGFDVPNVKGCPNLKAC